MATGDHVIQINYIIKKMKLPKLYAEFPGLATCLQMLSMKYGRHLDHVPSSSFV